MGRCLEQTCQAAVVVLEKQLHSLNSFREAVAHSRQQKWTAEPDARTCLLALLHGWLVCICVACVHMSRISCISGDVLPVCRRVPCARCMSCGTCAANVMSCAYISLCPCLRPFCTKLLCCCVSAPVFLRLSQFRPCCCVTCSHGEQSFIRMQCHGIPTQPHPEHTIHCYGFKCWESRGRLVGGAAALRPGEDGGIHCVSGA